MARLDVGLLGPLQIRVDGEPLTGFGYDKVRALLAYLAVEADQAHRREALATLLWPEVDSRAARHNLSQALWSLRRALGDSSSGEPWLVLDGDSVRINPDAGIRIDVAELGELLDACDRHIHRGLDTCRACTTRLEQVAELYRGDLLEGFSLPDALPFDEWLLAVRERLRRRVVAALPALATYHQRRGNLVRAARAAQRQIDIEPWHEEGWRALMRALAASGRRAEAVDAYERCRRILDDELGIEPDAETATLAQRIRAGTFELPVTTPARLPEQPAPFVGRKSELSALTGMLADPDCRLVTLVGPGGIGKTRLAVQLARDEAGAWADGARFVSLAGLAAPDQLATAIGDVVGIAFHSTRSPQEQLLDWLADRDLLLVLDNAEHLLEGMGLVTAMLERAPRVQVLVTSRERLNLRHEWVVEVQGLSTAGEAGDDAARLFVQRGRQSRPGFEPDAGDRTAIERICRLTAGMPLALEIAAAWLAVLTCEEIAGEIERGLDFLATNQRDMPERHRSVRAVFDASWERLGDPEQRAFRRVSVFQGGFDRAAAEHVTGTSLPVLSALVGKSLLQRTAAGRYRLHELLRQYGAERLAAEDEAEVVGERHSRWYLSFLSAQEPRLKGPEQALAIVAIRGEIENLRLAWWSAIERGRFEELEMAARSLWVWWDLTGRYQEWESLLGPAVTALDGRSEEAAGAGRRQQHGILLTLYGGALQRLGNLERGRAAIDRGVALARDGGDGHELGLALNYRAMIARAEHDVEAERRDLRESIAAFEAAGDRWGAAYSRNDLGALEDQAGDAAMARRLEEESLTGFTALGDRRGMAFALTSLGVAAARRGDFAAARQALEESLAIRRELENPWGIATSLIQLGIVARQAGDDDDARRRLLNALRTAWEVRCLPVVTDAAIELAELDLANGHREPAIGLLAALREHPAAAVETRQRAAGLLDTLGLAPPAEAGALDRLVRAVLEQSEPVAAVGS